MVSGDKSNKSEQDQCVDYQALTKDALVSVQQAGSPSRKPTWEALPSQRNFQGVSEDLTKSSSKGKSPRRAQEVTL